MFCREKRLHISIHPRTPDPTEGISKRAFEGCIKAWRRALHLWDNGEVRPDLNPELVKIQVKKPTEEVKFDDKKEIGQKRKITHNSGDENQHKDDSADEDNSYANKLRKQQIELELGTEQDDAAVKAAYGEEELDEDGYISEDIL